MLTPGITAEVTSDTVPVIVPRSVWAKIVDANNDAKKIVITNRRMRFLLIVELPVRYRIVRSKFSREYTRERLGGKKHKGTKRVCAHFVPLRLIRRVD